MISEKNTKAQILAAYNELLKERDALATQLKTLQNAKKEQPSVVEQKADDLRLGQVSGVADNKMTAAIQTLSALQLGFGSAISELSERLTSKAARLQDLRDAVAQEEQKLAEFHNLDLIQEDTLENLLQSYTDHSKAFELELSQSKEAREQELQARRKAWKQEQHEQDQLMQELNETEEKRAQRESQEYAYNLTLQRDLDQTEYAQIQANLYQTLEEAKLTQEKRWAEREKAIAQQEQQFYTLRTQVETADQEKDAAVEGAIAEIKEKVDYEVTVERNIRSKELDGETRVYELKIQALEQTIETNEEQIQTLSKQLDAALKQVQDLAVKAIEGSANVQSYQAFKEIALEQAKTQLKGK